MAGVRWSFAVGSFGFREFSESKKEKSLDGGVLTG
jgi:hypothetical protein